MSLQLHERAKAEIREAGAWYAQQSPGLDRRFYAEVRAALEAVEVNPLRYGKLETNSQHAHYRRVLLVKFPYHIVFEVTDGNVFVYAVAHSSRRPNYWSRRRRPRQ